MLTVSHPFAAFVPGDGLLHRLDPRTKMAMVLALGLASAAARTLPGLLVLLGGGAAAVAVARPPARYLVALLRILLVLAAAALVLNGLFTPGSRLPGPSEVPIWPTVEGVAAGIVAAVRLLSMACAAFALVATTSPGQLAETVDVALGRFAPLRGAGVAANVAFRFLPDFIQEAQRMRLIRAIRTPGRALDVISKLREAGSIMLALIVIAVRRAERVADAMTARCYQGGGARSAWRARRFTGADGAALGATAALCTAALIVGLG